MSAAEGSASDSCGSKQPGSQRRSESRLSLTSPFASASAAFGGHSRSISLPNPLRLIQRAETSAYDDSYPANSADTQEQPSFLDNLLALGQAAVDAANIGERESDDESDQESLADSGEEGEEVIMAEQPIVSMVEQPGVRDSSQSNPRSLESTQTEQACDSAVSSHQEDPPLEANGPVSVVPDQSENYSMMCPVCLEPYYMPHKCQPCKHVFCEPCLRRMRRTDMNSPTRCPLCREKIKKCVMDKTLSRVVASAMPETLQARQKMEKKQKHKLPPLPGVAIAVDTRFGRNMLATWSAVCGVVLLMMFVFVVFATLVGFILWYTMEVLLDVVGELFMEMSDFFSFSWQALIILYIEGKIPQEISEVLGGSASRIMTTLSRLVNRTKTFFTEGEVPPPQVHLYMNYDHLKINNTTHLLTKVTQANLVNYVFLAGLFTYVLYRLAKYFQNDNNDMQAPVQ